MSGFDSAPIYIDAVDNQLHLKKYDAEQLNNKIKKQFFNFINNFRRGREAYYREQLIRNYSLHHYFLQIRLGDLARYDEELYNNVWNQPLSYLHLIEESLREALQINLPNHVALEEIPAIQVLFEGEDNPIALRKLTANQVSKMVCVTGIVISSSRVQARAVSYTLTCRKCNDIIVVRSTAGSSILEIPKTCRNASGNECPSNPYVLIAEKTSFIDQQILKIQEPPESIPTGEMPRHTQLIVMRYLVGKAVPGTRIIVVGILSLHFSGAEGFDDSSIRTPYIKALGIYTDCAGVGRVSLNFTEDEVAEIKAMARRPDIYQTIVGSIAPVIYGHHDIKCALACQLFGGCRKTLPDGMNLRGDINILLLGDPGTAKSQMLKFIERVAPIGVYTSGKGSSAAGLTASVVRDSQTREFYLEGGAMVLADGGIVCIDEFDKMRQQDRVAIHEAMEQQTISIAKAGITTILNARSAVLAAANPSFGVYDDNYTTAENLNEFRSTILSRFDAIFLIKDTKDQQRDLILSTHVVNAHLAYSADKNSFINKNITNSTKTSSSLSSSNFNGLKSDHDNDIYRLKRYISYCRQICSPRLTESASADLAHHYVTMRKHFRDRERSGEGNAIPITVRQLEAIIRFSEALAKMSLSPHATEIHVSEAIRLFTVSSIEATNSGKVIIETLTDSMRAELENIENLIKRRLPIDSSTRTKLLITSLSKTFNLHESSINRTISIMVQKEELEFRNKRKIIYRKR